MSGGWEAAVLVARNTKYILLKSILQWVATFEAVLYQSNILKNSSKASMYKILTIFSTSVFFPGLDMCDYFLSLVTFITAGPFFHISS